MTRTCEAGSPTVARLSLTLLGDFQARLGAGPPLRLRTRKTQGLLAYLGLPAGQAHSRDKIAALLWGEFPQAQARSRLRETLFALRRALAPADPVCLEIGGETLALTADAADVDAVTFEQLVRTGDPAVLTRAVELYRGDLLEGLAFRGSAFEDWLMPERERLRELAVDALAKLLAHLRSTGDAEGALRTGLRLVALDPLQESVHRTLMRLYGELGRRGMALRQYQTCVALLRRELDTEPEAETKSLYQDVVRRRVSRPGATTSGRSGHRPEDPLGRLAPPGDDTGFIGREHEVAQMREALGAAMRGIGRLVMLIGEAGIGKTSLLRVAGAEAVKRGMLVLVGRCYESDQILPFAPWVDAFREGRIADDVGLLATLDLVWRAELSRLLPELGTAGAQLPSGSDLALFEGVAQLIERLSRRQPLALIIEDLHWADEMSLRMLAYVSRRVPETRALLLASAREEELAEAPAVIQPLHELLRTSVNLNLRLATLSRTETQSLVRSLTSVKANRQAARRLEEEVWAVSEGNPFVAVEVTRAALYAMDPKDAPIPLPDRVKNLAARRLARLSDRGRRCAAVAAVIGREFEFPLLHRAAELDEAAAAEAVEELVRRHVFQGMDEHFYFIHERLRAVAYAELLGPERRLFHRRVAEALEQLHADDLEPHQIAVGMHYREARLWEPAFVALRQAGTAAMKRSAYREARMCLEQALGALDNMTERPSRIAQEIDVRLQLRLVLNRLDDLPRMGEEIEAARALAESSRDERRTARVLVHLSHYLFETGRPRDAAAAGERAISKAQAAGATYVELHAWREVACAHSDLGNFERAVEILRSMLESIQGAAIDDRRLLAVLTRARLAFSLTARGEFGEAVQHGRTAMQIAETVGDDDLILNAALAIGIPCLFQGNVPEAIRVFEQGVKVLGDRDFSGFTYKAWLGFAYALSDRLTEGLMLLDDAAAKVEASGRTRIMALIAMLRNEAWLLAGKLHAAREIAQSGLEDSRAQQNRGNEAWYSWQLARITASQDRLDLEHAEAGYLEALELARDLGMRACVAHCHAGLAALYRRADQNVLSRKHLAIATEMYRDMNMHWWLTRAEDERFWHVRER